MATPSWWNNWSIGTYNKDLAPLDILNALIPYLQASEQQSAARYLYGQSAADDTMAKWLANYNVSGSAQPATQQQYLQGASRASAASLPSYLDKTAPEANWLSGVMNLGKSLNPNMTREQQKAWRASYDTLLNEAPDDTMKSVASYVYNPSLSRPSYGSATTFGVYDQPYRTKGGLVANPYYST